MSLSVERLIFSWIRMIGVAGSCMIKPLPWAAACGEGHPVSRNLLCPLSIGTLGLFSCGRLQHGGRPCIHPSGSKSLASFHARDARPRGLSCACSGRTRVSRALLKGAMAAPRGAPLTRDVEPVEKIPKQILGRDAEKSDLLECATINDLMLAKGQVTPENIVLTCQKDFFYRLVMFKTRQSHE